MDFIYAKSELEQAYKILTDIEQGHYKETGNPMPIDVANAIYQSSKRVQNAIMYLERVDDAIGITRIRDNTAIQSYQAGVEDGRAERT